MSLVYKLQVIKLLSLVFKGDELNELKGHVALAYAQKSQIPSNTLLAHKDFFLAISLVGVD